MTIVSPETESVTGQQMAAALALAHLLEHDLPPAFWAIGYTLPGQLAGHVKDIDDGVSALELRKVLSRFAKFFGTEVVVENHGSNPKLVVHGVCRDIPVRVYGFISDRAAARVKGAVA